MSIIYSTYNEDTVCQGLWYDTQEVDYNNVFIHLFTVITFRTFGDNFL